jgi:hypothetical protein
MAPVPTTMSQYWRPEAVVVGAPFTFVGADVGDGVELLDLSALPQPETNPRSAKNIVNDANFCFVIENLI